nr:hypothetical protein [Erythrotrichia foliiformis]
MITMTINPLISLISIPHLINYHFSHSLNEPYGQNFVSSYHYLQSPQPEQKRKKQIQKKIIIVDTGNGNLNNFIRLKFKLEDLEQNNQEIGQQTLNSLLNAMKISGYFRSVNIKSKIINKQQRITIECHSMSPLKSVKIQNNHKVIIPQKLIYRLFKEQINKPQNYKLINKALKCIYKWYYEKGFQWVNVKVIQKEPESIELKITEGIINSIQFRFIKHMEESKSKHIFFIQSIREFLNIKEGCRLNYNEIETKLNELKQKNIFENCDYTVLKSKSQPEQLDLLLSIYEPPDRTTFLLGNNTNFRPGIVETIESKIFNSINIFFKDILYTNKVSLNQNNEQQEYLTNIRNKSYIPIYNYNSQKIINKILTAQHTFSVGDLYEWYANPTHFINSNSLGIHYNIQNIGAQKEYIKVNFKLPSVHKNLIITYCKPWITLYRNRNSLLQIKFIKESFYANHKKVTDLLSQIFNYKFIFLDSLSSIKRLKVKLKTQLDNCWGLKQTLRVESIEQKKTSLQKKSEILLAKIVTDLTTLKQNPHIFIHGTSQLVSNTNSNFFSIDTKLKYRFNYNHDIDWSKSGSNCMVLAKYSMPYTVTSQNKLSQHYKKFSQRTILKYTGYKHYDSEKIICNHHFSFVDLEFGNLIGSSTFFPWTEKFELKFPDYMIKEKGKIHNFPSSFYRIRLEHHLGNPENHSILLFCNYLHSNKRNLFHGNKDILNITSRIANNEGPNSRFNGGIGYQFRTSIHRLPPIRIEFSISPQSGITIYFRIIEVLSSIAVHKKT